MTYCFQLEEMTKFLGEFKRVLYFEVPFDLMGLVFVPLESINGSFVALNFIALSFFPFGQILVWSPSKSRSIINSNALLSSLSLITFIRSDLPCSFFNKSGASIEYLPKLDLI